MMSAAASFPSVMKPRFNIDQEKERQRRLKVFVEPAHTQRQILCSQLAMRLSISPVCLKQRL
jgi:hypothetical protein